MAELRIYYCAKCENSNLRAFRPSTPDDTICSVHKEEMQETNLTLDEFSTINFISFDDSFMAAMSKLKEDDIIEYQSRMSQFRSQVEQKKREKEQAKPHCPHCSSTNIEKIGTAERVGSIAVWGIFSKKINKSFKCKNCGYTW